MVSFLVALLLGLVGTQRTIAVSGEGEGGHETVSSNISLYDSCDGLNRSQTATRLYLNCSHLNVTVLELTSLPLAGLDLSHNLLTSPGDQLRSLLASLSYLDLSHNQINSAGLTDQTLRAEQGEESNLTVLSLSHNQLQSLPSNLFSGLHRLETLDLSFNPLRQLDINTSLAIGLLGSLQFLDLRGCELRSLQEAMMAGLTSLRSLDLSDNHLRTVDPAIRAVKGLKSLVIDNNQLVMLDRTSFEGLDHIQNLSVSYNLNLTFIEEDTFTNLVQLEDLRLAHNPSLYWIHPNAWSTERNDTSSQFSLKVFSLNDNNLTYLPSMLLPTFKDWYEIEYLDLQDNPWHCDCHNEWMMQDLIPAINASSPQLLADLDCGGPAGAVLGEAMYVVSQLSVADLPCDSRAHFDPWLKTFWPEEEEEPRGPPGSSTATVAVVIVLCVSSVLATAVLVFSLYRQQQRARGRDKYSLTGRMVGVVTQWGVGYVNQDFKHDEEEMTEIRSIQPWPPAS